eukprot:c24238_g4_i1 orf=52-447(+)
MCEKSTQTCLILIVATDSLNLVGGAHKAPSTILTLPHVASPLVSWLPSCPLSYETNAPCLSGCLIEHAIHFVFSGVVQKSDGFMRVPLACSVSSVGKNNFTVSLCILIEHPCTFPINHTNARSASAKQSVA